jgi:autotransporter-associated beta strand protein
VPLVLEVLEGRTLLTTSPILPGTLFAAQTYDGNAAVAGSASIPPDPQGAAGLNYLVSVVNSSLQVRAKSSGALVRTISLNNFFAVASSEGGLFDPRVAYDPYTGRFVVVALALAGANDPDAGNTSSATEVSEIHLAQSDTSDPTGTWHFLTINSTLTIGGVDAWADYPGLAISPNAIYVTANLFSFVDSSFLDSRLWIVDKTKLATGVTAAFTVQDPTPGEDVFSLQPAQMFGTPPPNVDTYLVASGLEDASGNDLVRVIAVGNPLGKPTFTATAVPLGGNLFAPGELPGAPQRGSSSLIETGDTRMSGAVWQNGSLWAVNTINPLSGPDAGQATVHFYEFDTSATPKLVQQGNVGGNDVDPGAFTYYPSIAVDKFNNVGIGFALSGPNTYAGSYYTVQANTALPGTVDSTAVLHDGRDFYLRTFGSGRNRWGDYSSISLDPADGLTFWLFNEDAQTRGSLLNGEDGRYETYFGAFRLPLVWDGGGADANWSNPLNWAGNVAPRAGDDLVFPSTAAQLSPVNNFAAGTLFNSITLTGSGYSLSGNAITLQAGITNNAGTNAIHLPITLKAAQSFTAAAGTSLSADGALTNGGFLLTINSGALAALDLGGVISGTGGLVKLGTGLASLSGASGNTYAGSTTVNAGTLELRKTGGAIAVPGALVVGDGAGGPQADVVRLTADGQVANTLAVTVKASGLLDLNGHSDVLGPLTLSGGSVTTGAGTLGLNGNVTASGPSTVSGNLSLGSATRQFNVASGGTLTVSAAVSGTGGLTKLNAGSLILSGNNTYAGTTTLMLGPLVAGSNSAFGTGALLVNGGTLQASGGAWTLLNPVTLLGNFTFAGTSDLTLAGPALLTGSQTVTVTSTGLTAFAGGLGETVAGSKLTKAGSGTLLLSGPGTYTGGVALTAGVLALGNDSALGTGTVVLNAGAVRADSGAHTIANPIALLGNITFAGAFDLTFAGPTMLTGTRTLTVTNTGLTTFAGIVGETVAGSKLTKGGSGTLLLSGNNTYTGATVVAAGLLLVNGSQPGSAVTVLAGATLGGTGTVGQVTGLASGTLSPGTGPGILTTGNLAFNSGFSVALGLSGGGPGSGYDAINAAGTVSLGNSTLILSLGYTPLVGDTFLLINNDGTDLITGTFKGLAEGATLSLNGMMFRISYQGGTGNDVVLTRVS